MAHGRIIQVGREFIPADKTIGFGDFSERELSYVGIDYIGDEDEGDAATLLLELLGDIVKRHYPKRRLIVVDKDKLKAKLHEHFEKYKEFVSNMELSNTDLYKANRFFDDFISSETYLHDADWGDDLLSFFDYMSNMVDEEIDKIYYNYSIDYHY